MLWLYILPERTSLILQCSLYLSNIFGEVWTQNLLTLRQVFYQLNHCQQNVTWCIIINRHISPKSVSRLWIVCYNLNKGTLNKAMTPTIRYVGVVKCVEKNLQGPVSYRENQDQFYTHDHKCNYFQS